MTRDPESITDEQVDAYLDGNLEPAEREAFERRLSAHPEVASTIALQAEIDAALKRLYPVPQVSQQQMREVLDAAAIEAPTQTERGLPLPNWSRPIRIGLVGLAAGLAWVIVAWQGGNQTAITPFFQPRPVALIYQDVVENGFQPYYECHEADRFAATFQRRQGQALRLAELPAGSRMLGLSYAGGLSRETTAMLCDIDGQPVMVFVDRLANDHPIASQHEASTLHVHRVARDGLVFYEVTPFEAARVIDHLVPQGVGAESK
jgi:anti-sigma factor RsiW